jgi:hypothetical protein
LGVKVCFALEDSVRFRTAATCLSAAALLTVVAAPGCASSDESTGFQPTKDASSDGFAGSSGSSGSGGSGASGGVGATGGGGSGGVGATGGGGGTEGGLGGFGGSGATGGSPEGGTCQPVFCPSVGTGSPCCVTPNGPCGVDYGFGNGCEVPTGPDV